MAEAQPPFPSPFEWRQTAIGRILVARPLVGVADHLFSTCDAAPPGVQMPDYAAVGAALGVSDAEVIRVRQVHGRHVVVRRPGDGPQAALEADVVLSTDPQCAVSVRVADCVPVLLADLGQRAVAAVHAGWRGTASGAVQAAVDALEKEGIRPRDLIAAIGPSIGPCCYQVDEMVRRAFERHGASAEPWFRTDGRHHWRLDLWRATHDQLVSRGVPSARIATAAICTAHDPTLWYSHRRQGSAAGRMVAAVRLRAAR